MSRRANAGGRSVAGVRAVHWDGRSLDGAWTGELADADAVVDLCGLSVGTWPWTGRHAGSIAEQPTRPRTALVEAMRGLPASFATGHVRGHLRHRWLRRCRCRSRRPRTRRSRTRSWVRCVATGRRPRRPRRILGVRVVIARTCVVVAPGAPALARWRCRSGCSSAGGSGPVVSGSAGCTSPIGWPRSA